MPRCLVTSAFNLLSCQPNLPACLTVLTLCSCCCRWNCTFWDPTAAARWPRLRLLRTLCSQRPWQPQRACYWPATPRCSLRHSPAHWRSSRLCAPGGWCALAMPRQCTARCPAAWQLPAAISALDCPARQSINSLANLPQPPVSWSDYSLSPVAWSDYSHPHPFTFVVQVRIHKFKAAINGPWDEAVPRLSRRVRAQLARPL